MTFKGTVQNIILPHVPFFINVLHCSFSGNIHSFKFLLGLTVLTICHFRLNVVHMKFETGFLKMKNIYTQIYCSVCSFV